MDFLDPNKRRAYTIRLIIGYGLMTIAILLGTVILVYAAYGYGINTKTGQIIQNGLIFVDSQPSGAKITLNGEEQSSNTSARLVSESGDYTLSLTKQGYREWKKTFKLNEHSVQRFVYPLLIPSQPVLKPLKAYTALPKVITSSPDKHWLVVLDPSSPAGSIVIDQFDQTDLTKAPTRLSLPSGVLKNADGTFQVIDWSSDNNHLLIYHAYAGGSEYALINQANITASININALFNLNPAKVSLVNKKSDQLYLYDSGSKELKIGDISRAAVAPAILKNVIAHRALTGNLLIYVTDKNFQQGLVEIHVLEGSSDYRLSTIPSRAAYVLDASQYQGHWYYALSGNSDSSINIYKDPIQNIKDPLVAKAQIIEAVNLSSVDNVSFSSNGRFLLASHAADFAGYDFDAKTKLKFSLASVPQGVVQWLDNYHLITTLADNLTIMDYDGANQQSLTTDSYYQGAYLSKDFKHLVLPQAAGAGTTITDLNLRVSN